jgi:orotidine-5'-phosphate decarboxylase
MALEIRGYRPHDEAEVVELWLRAGLEDSAEAAHASIAEKLGEQPELFFVAVVDGRVAGSAMAGWDGHRGWLHRVAVLPEQKRRGIARALVDVAERALAAVGCPKVNLQVRAGNTEGEAFWRSVGYRVEERVSMGKRLSRPAPASPSPRAPFADRLIARVRQLGHPLCAGLDPFAALVPRPFRAGDMSPAAPATAAAIEAFLVAYLDRVAGRVAIVKPQSACFEALGPRGIELLARVIHAARARDLLVLLDAKRGDIGSTAEAYADAYLAEGAPLAVDALTVNPYPGTDTLEPYVARAAKHARGLFVLAKTSNPGSGELQDRSVDGAPLYEQVARMLAPQCERLRCPETGWSSVGIVAGATYPEQSVRLRSLLPRALFLVPGYGAQSGSARDAVRCFVAGPGGRLEGGIVNSSRALLFPAPDAASARDWERAVDAALERAIAELTAAIRPN